MTSHFVWIILLVAGQSAAKFAKTPTCGSTTGCYHDCDSSDLCTFVVTWKENGADVDFSIKAENSRSGDTWMAIGFSHDREMGDDPVTECVWTTATSSMTVKNSYNTGQSNSRLANPDAGISSIVGSLVDGVFTCSFSLAKTGGVQNADLNGPYYILFGSGQASGGAITKHEQNPLSSGSMANFLSFDEIFAVPQDYSLVKAHGCLMVIAWILAASIGVILPRYYKPMWPDSKMFGEKVWFQLHRSCMMLCYLATIIGFILIFVSVGKFSELDDDVETLKIAHPIIGIIVTVLVFFNPIMAIFRPHPGTKNRPIFNWAHWGVGTAAHILGVVNCFLGVRMGTPSIPEYVVYILAAFVVWHLLFELILQLFQFWSNKKATEEYELQQNGNVQASQRTVPQGEGLKMFLLVAHVVIALCFCLAVVVIIAIS